MILVPGNLGVAKLRRRAVDDGVVFVGGEGVAPVTRIRQALSLGASSLVFVDLIQGLGQIVLAKKKKKRKEDIVVDICGRSAPSLPQPQRTPEAGAWV